MDIEAKVRDAMRTRRDLPDPPACKELREKSGLSQRALGDLLKVSPSTVRLWELGERKPTGPRLDAYVRALRVMRESA